VDVPLLAAAGSPSLDAVSADRAGLRFGGGNGYDALSVHRTYLHRWSVRPAAELQRCSLIIEIASELLRLGGGTTGCEFSMDLIQSHCN
jgi:hypothetical protein